MLYLISLFSNFSKRFIRNEVNLKFHIWPQSPDHKKLNLESCEINSYFPTDALKIQMSKI